MRELRDLALASPQTRAAADLQSRADQHVAAVQQRALPAPGPARALPPDLRTSMEGALGMDFSRVRLHEGARASAMGALAYTQGSDIHFASGHYQPDTRRGRELLGHELAHVVQQAQGRVHPTGRLHGVPTNDDPAMEREADALGHAAATSTPSRPQVGSATTRALPRSSSSAAVSQSMPVQRVIHPTLDPSVGARHPHRLDAAAAERYYDEAWRYLWTSPTARRLYAQLHDHARVIDVRVGSEQSFTSHDANGGADCIVEWNPFEVAVLTDTDTRLDGFDATQIHNHNLRGTMPSALLLIHELGHAKQHIETWDFGQQALRNHPNFWANQRGQVPPPTGNMRTWLDRVHQYISSLYPRGQAPPLMASTVRPTPLARTSAHTDIVEPDNVTRHEHPVQVEKNELLRRNYSTTLPLDGYLRDAQRRLVAPPQRAAPNWPVTHSHRLGGGETPMVDTTIVTHLGRLLAILTRDANVVNQDATTLNRHAQMRQYLIDAYGFFINAPQRTQDRSYPFGRANRIPTYRNP